MRWLWGADAVKVPGKSGISQARSRLGKMSLRRLYGIASVRWTPMTLLREVFAHA